MSAGLRHDGQDFAFPKAPPPAAHDQGEVEEDGRKVLYRHFSSVADYCALRASSVNLGKDDSSGGSSWFGVGSRAEALAICRSGVWPAGLRRLEQELSGFDVAAPRSVKRKGTWADQGDALDIHRVYAGQLDTAWRRCTRSPRPASQSLVISFPLMISSMHHADKLFWCGAAALKLADLLTVAGYNVTLVGTHGTEYGGHTGYDSLIVKDSKAPLDVESLLIAMAFPGFTRTAGFTAVASYPFAVSSGLGTALYDTDVPLKALRLPESSVLRGLFDRVSSRESARSWIEQQISLIDQTHLEMQS